MKIKYILIIFLLLAILVSAFLVFHTSAPNYIEEEVVEVTDSSEFVLVAEKIKEEYLYGFRVDTLQVIQKTVEKNQSLSEILLPFKVEHQTIFTLAQRSKDVFDVRKINPNKPYTLICTTDSTTKPLKFIYEPNRTEYIVFHLDDSIYSERVEREISVRESILEGTIDHSLSVSIEESGQTVQLTNSIVDVMAWQIDFFRLQKGDRFKVLFREKVIEDEVIGIEDIQAVYFEHFGNPYYAVAYDQGEGTDYFDEEGKSIRKALLRYPLEFTRISSRYNLNRFHPVQKRWKAHLGTDFAAPRGTPIRSVGDGIITEARFSQYNGNYVKVKHNGTFTTQYLHMSGIASGIKEGIKVKQGQLIGYVGSTGLATGDHLCYRFWKNGVQVDALNVELPPSNPVKSEHLEQYQIVRDSLLQKLNAKGHVLSKL